MYGNSCNICYSSIFYDQCFYTFSGENTFLIHHTFSLITTVLFNFEMLSTKNPENCILLHYDCFCFVTLFYNSINYEFTIRQMFPYGPDQVCSHCSQDFGQLLLTYILQNLNLLELLRLWSQLSFGHWPGNIWSCPRWSGWDLIECLDTCLLYS